VSFPNGLIVECPDSDYELVFVDDFNGLEIDPTAWDKKYGDEKPFDKTKWPSHFTTPSNVRTSGYLIQDENLEISPNGTLLIKAIKETVTYEGVMGTDAYDDPTEPVLPGAGENFSLDYNYTSGALVGKNEIGFQPINGLKIEARFILPKGKGLWPAFWAINGLNEVDFLEIFDTEETSFFSSSIHDENQNTCTENTQMDLADGNWHTMVGELTPYFFKIYVDDILMVTVPKYRNLSDEAVATECGEVIAPGTTLKENGIFPRADTYYPPILSLAIQPDDALNMLVGELAIMEVDYLKIYQRSADNCWNPQHYDITENTNWLNTSIRANSINVEAGKTLTITNSTIQTRQFDGIILEEGATLILDNSTLTSCRNQWNGISAAKEASIIMKNSSTIENAVTAIDGPVILDITNSTFLNNHVGINNSGHTNPLDVQIDMCTFEINMTGIHISDRADGIFHMTNTTFQNIELQDLGAIGVKLTNVQANSIIEDCEFYDSTIGIQAMQSDDINVHQSLFTQSNLTNNGIYNAGIESIESYINVSESNRFIENYHGIDIHGSFPLVSGAQIGLKDQDHNIFERNMIGIRASGNDHPKGISILNNEFDNSTTSSFSGIAGVSLGGANMTVFENNSLTRMQTALAAGSTGGNFNRFNCNEYTDSYYTANRIAGDNNKSKILENDFSNPIAHTADIYMTNQAHINEVQQGETAADAAANCFTKNGIDDLLTSASTINFTYRWFDDNSDANCQLPTSPGNYILPPLSTANEANNCGQDGIGTTQIVGGGGEIDITDIFTTIPDTPIFTDYDNACLSCIEDSIATTITQVINTGNDNPFTYTDDSGVSTDGGYSEEVLDDWINLALYIAIETENYNYAEQILTPLKKRRWQIRLFGIYVLNQDYAQAANILTSLPQNTLDEVYFHDVQRINMKRLTTNEQTYVMNQVEDVRLREIALAMQPSSGYAISLYRILTGEHISIDYSYLTVPTKPRSQSIKNTTHTKINLYPNPANNMVTIEVEEHLSITSVEVVDFNSKSVMNIQSGNTLQLLDIEHLPRGIYAMSITLSDGSLEVKKLIKL